MKPANLTKKPRFHLSYERSKAWAGFLFITPWLIGAIWFFVIPFVYSFIFSVSNLNIDTTGIQTKLAGLTYYTQAMTGDPTLMIILMDILYKIWYQVLLVIVFSGFLAMLMNGKYKGRLLVRGIFFLPVIIASGVIIQVFAQSDVTNGMLSGTPQTPLFQGFAINQMLLDIGFPRGIVDMVSRIITSIFALVWKSGVQTILLLAGLQTVPKTAYEAAQIEGATNWEIFWKITFPIISPIFVLCSFYTVIDLSNDSSHPMVQYIYKLSSEMRLSYAATIANVWFAIVMVLVGIVFLLARRRVYFMEDMS